MQKFKTMSKLKLKTVQNGTEVENPNLMESGSYDYVDCSGYVIIGSGVYDNSGNLVEEGRLVVDAGHADIDIGTVPAIRVNASWDSGSVDLPINFILGAFGYEPCFPVNFEYELLLTGSGDFDTVIGDVEIKVEWMSPFVSRVHASYTLANGNGAERKFGAFTPFAIPYYYEPPQNNNINE